MKLTVLLLTISSSICFVSAIVNGKDAPVTPYQASIQVNEVHLCGGVVIHPYFVLTVAHFIANNDILPDTSIFVGSLTLSGNGRRFYPSKFIPHEKHSAGFPYHYDIGLVKVTRAIFFNLRIPLIPIMFEFEELQPCTELTFTGWGLADQESGYRPDKLQTVPLKIVSNDECKERYGVEVIGEGEFCSISPAGSGPCNNDSGGPVVYNGRLYGIDSYGNSDNCDGEKPDITTSVPFHFRWIFINILLN